MFEGDKNSPILDYTNQELSDYIILDESGEVVKDSCYEDKIRDLIVSNILEKDYKGDGSNVNISPTQSPTSTGSSPKVRILRRLRNRVIYDIEEGEDNKENDIMRKDIMKDVIDELVMYVRNKSAIKFQSLARTYLAIKKGEDIGETDKLVNDIVEGDKGERQVENTGVNLLTPDDYVWQPEYKLDSGIIEEEVEKLKDMCVVEKPDVNEDIDKEKLLNNCPGGHTLLYFEEKEPIFICDMCDEYCYGVFFGCRECDYDVCEKCQSWGFGDNEDYKCGYSNIYEELEERENMYLNCPQGHTLYELNATDNKNKYYCDLCHKYNKDGLVFYGCDSCNWDVCVNCVPDWKKRVVNLDTETNVDDKEKGFWESTALFSGLALTIGVGVAVVGSAVSSVFNRRRYCRAYSTLDERDICE